MAINQEPGSSSSSLLPRHQMGLALACRLSSSDESFRSRVAHRPIIIQKVPQSVRDSLEERYFVPEVVSIGPYHHRARRKAAPRGDGAGQGGRGAPVLPQLVLPQLALSWLPRCWLINMVAPECVTDRSDRCGVSSYLAILGSLVRAERDVEELRSRRILFSTMSDRLTVVFFDPLPRQELYLRTLEEIVRLRRRRRIRSIRSGIHAVYYGNRRIILAAAPLLSQLVAIVGTVVTNSIKHK